MLAFFVSACSDGRSLRIATPVDVPPEPEDSRKGLTFDVSDSPVDLIGISASFAADMRYGAAERNFLDIDNVASYGVSAGAGASLWLGTHDDMADQENAAPVLRESTCCGIFSDPS